MRRVTIAAALITGLITGLLAAACGTGHAPGAAAAPRGVLTIANSGNGPWTCGFNPFNGSATSLSLGPVYEPLAFVNALQNGRATPWLATSWRWGPGDRSLTFTIRRGVTFSDGTPMTAADVAFSFNLIQRHPDLDLYGVWSVLSGVRQTRAGQVLMTFTRPAVPYFYYIASEVPVVPERVWSKIANPGAYPDTHPVGTGAFLVSSCTKADIVYAANRRYWRPGEPRVAEVKYPSLEANDPANTLLATGAAQWGSQFIPNIRAFYLSQSPDFRFWFPPTTTVSLLINMTDPLLRNVKIRQAMAYAIDRPQVASYAEYGYESAANQADIVTPTFSAWLDRRLLARYGYSYDPARARRLLASAGLRPGRDGVLTDRAGHRLTFAVLSQAGYTDWTAAIRVIEQNLKAVGIAVKLEDTSPDNYQNRLSYGRFQLAYGSQLGGPTPFYELRQWLYSGYTAPVGQAAATNYERYRNAQTDRLLASYEATTSTAVQHLIVARLERAVLETVPFIPVTEAADWFEYDTATFSGWPTAAAPYAQPSVYITPDWGQVLLHLSPK
jgi:peptide/nickel transport system substrate-binding protein